MNSDALVALAHALSKADDRIMQLRSAIESMNDNDGSLKAHVTVVQPWLGERTIRVDVAPNTLRAFYADALTKEEAARDALIVEIRSL